MNIAAIQGSPTKRLKLCTKMPEDASRIHIHLTYSVPWQCIVSEMRPIPDPSYRQMFIWRTEDLGKAY